MKFIAVSEDNIKGIFIYIHGNFIKIMIDPIRYPDKSNPKILHLTFRWGVVKRLFPHWNGPSRSKILVFSE